MSDSQQFNVLNINSLREPILRKLSEVLDKTNNKGWRKLAEVVGNDKRFKLSSLELEKCSLKVLEPEGSPSRSLLRLMGERGCTVKELVDFLQVLGHTEVVQYFKPPGPKIIVQPEAQAVLAGQRVKLCCLATGHPFVQYQWFKLKEEVPHGNSPELVLSPVHTSDAGFYICRVNNGFSFEFSQWAQLDICDISAAYGSMFLVPENKLQIVIQPQTQKLLVGDTLVLECGAVGKPIPRYQWLRNGVPVKDGTKKIFMIPYVNLEHQGTYACSVYNDQMHQRSRDIEVLIGSRHYCNVSIAVECAEELSGFDEMNTRAQLNQRSYATDKVALLIGNMTYRNHPQLKAPMVDVYELTNLLRQLDFKVVSLLDLTESEMRNAVYEFLLLLDKGVYGLLYYAGHGYENYGNSFMVPIDAPNPYRSANCLCVQSILKQMQEKETGLNVFLLDMCRKRNFHDDTLPITEALRVTANIVFGYATCQGAEAFEIQHSGLANGIFMKFLKERLLEDEKITVLLDRVAEDMGKCHLTKGKQALEIRSSLSEKKALTDPIQQSGCSVESLARNLQWAKAHELPESMCLDFECGVQIKLGFAAEFSNVMVIYTRVVKKPPDIILCEAFVTDFHPDLDVDPKQTNRGTPEETGSYVLIKDLPEHCFYTRLSSLQKLMERLVFTVCLHYQYRSMEDTVDERKEVDVGKPLIAKLDIHRGARRNSCLQTCRMPHSPSHSPAHSPSHSPAHSPGLNEQCVPHSHHYSNSYLGVYLPNHPHAGSVVCPMPSDSCQYNTCSAWNQGPRLYSNANRINVPIETTDDTDGLHSDFSKSIMFSDRH
ncbi:mucosa-associated lymphoid tissue lymphoma translocation protein 1 isoform X2 [Latimeria chalumnae]|uniref:mucosa-associated lymphoid tissue lymphoma translocation protein 1 isoform X2 n=1 Tax=Latimeria chalumnae TaxID=7897 RepID=UPI0003C11D84|nr:PREDICTED: mucosa-associated lymphoid tissue lymphoma translocation protein 1 isoform X2 [Latimeria chalumnae]|eukprot:XP_006009691.1 PREDICTED: mucosa-associated lymphoid tissue lymphoma translocation protein 1 isoform X2 [Latimeria chalumnae]